MARSARKEGMAVSEPASAGRLVRIPDGERGGRGGEISGLIRIWSCLVATCDSDAAGASMH